MYLRLQTMDFEGEGSSVGVYTLWDSAGLVLRDHPTDFSNIINSDAFNTAVRGLFGAKIKIRTIDEPGPGFGKFCYVTTIQQLNDAGEIIQLDAADQ